ncbi:hypothetical protein ROZALSC1DRAFT_27448 [Rozella allomycis CSF55]|uniref:Non-structural maintenance of chromosomes element 4 n=1 Tax=Rozella allomycis (strain CSF55) TaxID=988480 RepID=A0A075AT65_ROZAC|nr:Non-structural maintenance of chromosome element 4 domain-containing protein [Rozella allomycis CSF55]RKP21116.1 hypothetical protein ROZALSC1DRAFT_27448 [Rozella allomycis CSF55]|eukprot:EPZ31703.1 Non-structural maintenance of chromosome element 4 domain-containing protein [Rozella allomycis CSF55]
MQQMEEEENYSERERNNILNSQTKKQKIQETQLYDPNQSIGVKRFVRNQYRNMAKILEENKAEALKADSNLLSEVVERANQLSQHIRGTSEAVLDARLLMISADLSAEKVSKLQLGRHPLDLGTFRDQVKNLFSRQPELRPHGRIDWRAVGAMALNATCGVFTFNSLLGSFEIEKKEKRKIERKRNNNELKAEVERPRELSREDVLFLIDPNSFGRSVELLFFFSFLVKEKRVTLKEENKELMVYINEQNLEELEEQNNRQFVFGFTFDIWKAAIKKYNIEYSHVDKMLQSAKGK